MNAGITWPATVRIACLVSACVLLNPARSLSQPALGAWIDPGHGDGCPDVGAPGFNGNTPPDEKDLVLLVAQKVQSRLGGLGYTSALTRNSDHCLSVNLRPLIAAGLRENDEGVTEEGVIYVSIHMDGVADPNERGTFIIYPSPTEMSHRPSKRSYRVDSTLATFIDGPLQSNAAAAFLGCHNPKPSVRDGRGLAVMRLARIRSILVECCTISNQCQFSNIVQNGDQGLIADGIATGIANYLGQGLGGPNEPKAFAPPGKPYSVVAPPRTLVGPLQEGFEGAPFPPNGWSLTSSGAAPPYTWYRTTDPLYVGAGVGAALVEGEYASPIDERLISPMFRVSAADSTLRFRWLGSSTFAGNVMGSCEVRRRGETTWATVWNLGQENTGLVFSFPERVVGLGAWVGDSVQVSFHVVGTNGADFGVDEIATGLFPITGPPTNDRCATAMPLPAGAFAIPGNTCYAVNNIDPYTPPDGNGCVPEDASGGDVFYSLNALPGDTLRVHVPGSVASFTHLYLRDSCDSLSTTCLTSKEPSGGEVDSSLSYVFTTAGTYYLIVDTMGGACGDFVLSGTWRGPVTSVDGPVGDLSGIRLSAAPNPSRTGGVRLTGTAGAGLRGNGTLRIFDAAGRLIHSSTVSVSGSRFEASWDGRTRTGARLSAGVYIAKLELGGKTASASFVVSE